MAQKDTGWWTNFFDDFRTVFDNIPARYTNAQVKYLIDKLNLKPGRKFLDCPCGVGRIAIPLARKGIKVTGVDITKSYLDELASKLKRTGLKMNLVHSDMRRINYDAEFDAAANIWTSFGYFEKESDNLLVLKKTYKALKPGGKFLMYLINRDWLMANYKSSTWFPIKNGKVLEENKFDYTKSINYCTWHFIMNGNIKSCRMNLRLYSLHELINMFTAVGFINIQSYDSIKEKPVSRESTRIIVIGEKPNKR